MGLHFKTPEEMEYPIEPEINSIKYVKKGRDTCPRCGGDNLSRGVQMDEGENIYRDVSCGTCGLEWTERFTLAGICEDKQGRNCMAFDVKGQKGVISLGDDGLTLYLDEMAPCTCINVLTLADNLLKSLRGAE